MSTPQDTDELRALLGLGSGDHLEQIAEVELPQPDADLGFATGEVWADVQAAPRVEAVVLGFDSPLKVWARRAGVYRFERRAGERLTVLKGISSELSADHTWVDARTTPAEARLETSSGMELLVGLHAHKVSVSRVVRELSVPTLETLHATQRLPDWLRELFAGATQAESKLDRVAVVGYVLRHAPLGAAGASIAELARIAELRKQATKNWWTTRPATLRAELARRAQELAEQLTEGLIELDQGQDGSEAEWDAMIESLCLERERLAAVVEVISLGEPEEDWTASLAALDAEAHAHLAFIAGAVSEQPLLGAVTMLEPESWWGMVAAQDDPGD